MGNDMMAKREIRPEDIGQIFELHGPEIREATREEIRSFVAQMGVNPRPVDVWGEQLPSRDELVQMDVEQFHTFLATPETVDARERRFNKTAELLGTTPDELMLRLLAMPLVLEEPVIKVAVE